MSIHLASVTPAQVQLLEQLRQSLRPGQRRIADWQQGILAVSAVPGSGKSTGMAIASAILLTQRYLQQVQLAAWEDQAATSLDSSQLLLVTFTRSAVANLKTKIRQYLRDLAVPSQGFMVHTLHGLALHIATRHPQLSGLDLERLTLISPNQSNRLIRTSVEQWIAAYPQTYQQLLEGRQFDGEETERLRRQAVLRTEILPELADTIIHEAKSSGLQPDAVWQLAQQVASQTRSEPYSEPYSGQHRGSPYEVLAIGAGLYERYQALLQQRGFIDYDDMILAALQVLQDDKVRQFWQSQIFAVFEDEAQDSSPLQTRLLEILAADPGKATTDPIAVGTGSRSSLNLVRVGDPNQAINSTFTPADPLFFAEFCQQCAQSDRLAEMDQAGRSSLAIMEAANFALTWVNDRYGKAGSAPFRHQLIRPVPRYDPQPDANPDPEGNGLEIRFPPDVYRSIELIAQRVADLLSREPEARAAILVRENRQGRFITDRLRHPQQYDLEVDLGALGIAIFDVGEDDRHSHLPSEVLAVLQFLDRPHSPDSLKGLLQLLVQRQLIPPQDLNALISLPEQFLYPSPIDPPQSESVWQARRYCTGLLRARLELPHYQLIPFIALTLQFDQAELATADKLAHRISQQTAGQSSMAATLEVLHEIVRSERFEPIETDDPDSRYIRPGQLTIITMHKAKGLDWDFVFIPFLHEQVLPGSLRVLPQSQFLGDFNLAEVARVQIRSQVHGEPEIPDPATAWQRASDLKLAEEYRLLYVAMTRARRLLWMSAARQAPFSWSKPENLEGRSPCPLLPALAQRFPQALPHRSP
ncbi:MAG: ATP-dependent helicase [Elainella sp. Prado103]|nr:ATP-dependent helicase [Elainella sp. Prado103]